MKAQELTWQALQARIRFLLASEFFRYLISGSIAFVCDFGTLVFVTEVLGFHYLVSNIAGYAVGLVVSYTINVKWVFRHRRFDDRKTQEFVYFTIIVFVGLGISELVLWLATDTTDMAYTTGKFISTIFVFLFNFLAKKFLLFSPPSDVKPGSDQ